jgi:glutathione S-transferase
VTASTPTHLYHVPQSRSARILWALEEIGAPYDVTVLPGEDRRGPAHVARHPLGRVPVIDDGGEMLFESAAIVLALADRHPDAELNFPLGSRERELVYQWVLFGMLEIEVPTAAFRDAAETDPERAAAARERVVAAATVVDHALRGHEVIVGERFSAADIVLGSVLAFADRVVTLEGMPEVARYIEALAARPARLAAYAPAAAG